MRLTIHRLASRCLAKALSAARGCRLLLSARQRACHTAGHDGSHPNLPRH
ncbi:MAG: hypothetical protein Q8Q98_16295 [Polaromonas sp.]|nr:hypothetical protein [Polaromonas sp.]